MTNTAFASIVFSPVVYELLNAPTGGCLYKNDICVVNVISEKPLQIMKSWNNPAGASLSNYRNRPVISQETNAVML